MYLSKYDKSQLTNQQVLRACELLKSMGRPVQEVVTPREVYKCKQNEINTYYCVACCVG